MARELCEDKLMVSGGFCYPEVSSSQPKIHTHLVSQIHGFQSSPAEMFNLTTGMEMIGFSKNPHQQQRSDMIGFYNKPGNNNISDDPSSKALDQPTSDFYQHEFDKRDFTAGISVASGETLTVGPNSSAAWQENRLLVDDSSLRCVFPCEGNERPSRGLSLALCSSNPSSIGLQSFELRHTTNHQSLVNPQEEMRFMHSSSRGGFSGKAAASFPQQQQIVQDVFLGKAANLHHQGQFQVMNCKYLCPAQELLNEFCSLAIGSTKQTDAAPKRKSKLKQWEDEHGSASSSRKQAFYTLELMESQKRKTKLVAMLEELDRRYEKYCDQMKSVVSSFEAVAGAGAASVYSALASKTMSRHFRCLRDGIVSQIHSTKKAVREKDPVAPGTTRGETPTLRIVDQALRQQKALQQTSMMERYPWKPQRGLPERSVSVLRAWLFEHFLHPYPSDVDKHILARQSGLSRSQVCNWFINARVRLWKPMVEEMYLEETKDEDRMVFSSDCVSTDLDEKNGLRNQNPSSSDQKPTPDQLIRIDSERLSSIKRLQSHQQQYFGNFGAMELDFSSYNHQSIGGVSFANGGGGGGVSLTLGLQQQGGSGGNLAFSPSSQSSLFYPGDHIEESQPVQYSLLNGEGQALPCRNSMGAQLLHDLAGYK